MQRLGIGLLGILVGAWLVFLMLQATPPKDGGSPPVIIEQEYPLDLDMVDKQEVGDGVATVRYRVDLNSDNTYTYHYWISYKGSKTYLYTWEVLDNSMGEETIVELAPNCSHEFVITHPVEPTFSYGATQILQRVSRPNSDEGETVTWERRELNDLKGPEPTE